MADVPATSIAGNIIITPDMVPPAAEPLETQAMHYKALAEKVGELQQQLKAANAMREEAAQSPGWEAGHEKNRQLAADYGRMAGIYSAAADYFNGVAGVYRDARTAQQSVVIKANAELSQAKNAIQQQEIVARWHAHARSLTTSAVGAATAKAGVFEHTAGTDITALTSRLGGPAPQDPVLTHSGGGGIAVPTGKEGSGLGDDNAPTNGDPAGLNGGDSSVPTGANNGHGHHPKWGDRDNNGAADPQPAPALGNPFASGGGQMPMPGGGGSGIQSVGFPPGLTSMTDGLGSMPGTGGMGGLGSGGGLGGLPGGIGQLPGTQAAGLGNLPASATPAAGAPAQLGPAFSQGLSAGSALGSLPPATGTGTPAAGQAAATPAAGVTSGAGVPSAGLTAAGATPAAVNSGGAGVASSASVGGSTGAAPAMMLPPPGMGAPAAPMVAGGASAAAPVAPAGNTGSPGGSAPSAGPAAGSTAGSGGAVVVPASVVSAGAGARQRGRPESAELATAKALVRKLRRDSDIVNYACIEWAVGVFRREAGGATECVVMSNEGFGFIPRGVFLPRTACLLASDKLVDNQFRERWFGSSDAAEVLAEYARLRGRGGTHLVAMAVTAESPLGRVPGVEYAVCQREFEDGAYIRPILDDMHMHRLEALHPEVYARLQETTSADPEKRMVENQVVVPLAVQMIEAVKMSGEMTPDLRQMWDVLGTGDGISEEAWNQYRIASTVYYVNLSANRPRPEASTGDRERYHAQWVTARTMELLAGWERRPVDVADMVYAAATAYPGDFVTKFELLWRVIESELVA